MIFHTANLEHRTVFINNFAKNYHTSREWKNETVKYVWAIWCDGIRFQWYIFVSATLQLHILLLKN